MNESKHQVSNTKHLTNTKVQTPRPSSLAVFWFGHFRSDGFFGRFSGRLGVRFLGVIWCLVFGVCCFSSDGAVVSRIDDPIEGQQLARELRSVFPAEEVIVKGTLRISRPGTEPREVPIESRVVIAGDRWSSIYSAKLPNGVMETLTVHHFTNAPNQYEWRRGDAVEMLDGARATNSFAGSDFALLDLGLEFYHWPAQILATREMRKGQGCDVLESRPAQITVYSRVVSWIVQESRRQGQPGLVMAEGYDPRGRILKEFEIKGLKEVAGQRQVSDMEMRNRQTKGATRLQFQFEEK